MMNEGGSASSVTAKQMHNMVMLKSQAKSMKW